jgi:hypothetical protein
VDVTPSEDEDSEGIPLVINRRKSRRVIWDEEDEERPQREAFQAFEGLPRAVQTGSPSRAGIESARGGLGALPRPPAQEVLERRSLPLGGLRSERPRSAGGETRGRGSGVLSWESPFKVRDLPDGDSPLQQPGSASKLGSTVHSILDGFREGLGMRETGQLQLEPSTSDPDNPFLTNTGLLGGGERDDAQNVNPPSSDAAETVFLNGGFWTQGFDSKASENGDSGMGGREEDGMEGEAAEVELADLLNGSGKRSVGTEVASAAEQNKQVQKRQTDPKEFGAASLFQTEGASEGSESRRLDQWLSDRLQGPEETEGSDAFWARLQEGAGKKGAGLQNEVMRGQRGLRERDVRDLPFERVCDRFWADLQTEEGIGSGRQTEVGKDWEETRKRDGLLTFGMREGLGADLTTRGAGNERGLHKGLIGEEGKCRERDGFRAASRSEDKDKGEERSFFGEGLRSTSPALSWPFPPQFEKGKAGFPDLVNSIPRETPDGSFEEDKEEGNGDNGHNYNGKFLEGIGKELLTISAFGVFCPERGGYTVMRALDFNRATREHKICPFYDTGAKEAYWARLSKLKVRILTEDDFDGEHPRAFIPRRKKTGRNGRWQGRPETESRGWFEGSQERAVGSFERGRTARKMESEDVGGEVGSVNGHQGQRVPVAAPPPFSPGEHVRALETAPRSFRFVFQTEPEPSAQMLHFYSRHLFGIPPEPIEGTDAR